MASHQFLGDTLSPEIWPSTIKLDELYLGIPAGEYLVRPDDTDSTLAELTPVKRRNNQLERVKYIIPHSKIVLFTDHRNHIRR